MAEVCTNIVQHLVFIISNPNQRSKLYSICNYQRNTNHYIPVSLVNTIDKNDGLATDHIQTEECIDKNNFIKCRQL